MLSTLALTTFGLLYLAALLGLILPASVALAIAATAGVLALVVFPGACAQRHPERPGSHDRRLPGLALIWWTRPAVLAHIGGDVAAYGLMRYPEMRQGIVGPYFSYGHVYEFIVSYLNALFPPVGGLAIGHSLSLVFLPAAVVAVAVALRSVAGLVVGLALLFFFPEIVHSYALAGRTTCCSRRVSCSCGPGHSGTPRSGARTS